MRLFYISSGCGFSFQNHLSDEDQNIIQAFRQMEKSLPNFRFSSFLLRREHPSLLFSRIRNFRPDVILSFRGANLPASVVTRLRSYRIPIGVWVVDDPYRLKTHEQLVKPYHFVVTQDSNSVRFYRNRGKPAVHLPLAVNPDKYCPQEVPEKYRSDICFVGSAFPVRIHFFDTLTPLLLRHKTVIIGQWWEKLKNYDKLKACIHNRPIPPSEVVKYYNGAKIVLNIHRTSNDRQDNPLNIPAHTPNNRTFEIAACRAFQLATWREDMQKLYDPQTEMATFRGLNDLRKKIRYYLHHDEEREEMAANAYRRTLKDHTYVMRLKFLLHLLRNHPQLKGIRSKPARL
ncbi:MULTISPECIES: glycosyltransferase [Thermoactinomyces]|uniref:Glycosyltransferase n=1 Tax=Thermoactinomyces daqus TaxID=1329516 RepID=A0A7W2AI20_9BACL|nr:MULTISPECIES: glycosyltransferase [Thermoactinomyces]MBA4543777.1 glycosyltransferase [Thermoactinomyces daqus]MBH8598400.1 glycosyltransferase [Thermoactinomyces sp. CICC 10523]